MIMAKPVVEQDVAVKLTSRTNTTIAAFLSVTAAMSFFSVALSVIAGKTPSGALSTPPPGGEQTAVFNELPGWPFTTTDMVRNSPALIDLDGDNQRDVVFGSFDGTVRAVRADGTLLWYKSLGGDIRQSPAVGNVDSDGELEIVIGKGNALAPPPYYLYAYDRDGAALPGWPQEVTGALQGTAALGNLDGDAQMEIVVATYGGSPDKLYVFNGDGTLRTGWPQTLPGSVWASPVLANLDGDADLEIIIAHANLAGDVRAYNPDGSSVSGWSFQVGGVVRAAPVAGDIDGDSRDEVFIANEYGIMHGFDNTGSPLANWPVETGLAAWSTPVLYDIDADNQKELILAVSWGNVYVWNAQTAQNEPGWPVDLDLPHVQGQSSPVIVDIDNDNALEIVVGLRNKLYAFNHNGTVVSGWPITVGTFTESTASVADLNGDGTYEVAIGDDEYRMHVYSIGPINISKIPWGTYQQSYLREGRIAGCFDGTVNGSCSATQPYKCQNGILSANCQECGCPAGQQCQQNGTCVAQGNVPPVLDPIGNRTAYIGTVFRIQLHATDQDNDTLFYDGDPLPPGSTINHSTGLFSWTLAGDQEYEDQYQVTFSVSDGNGGADSETIVIRVRPLSSFLPGTSILMADGSTRPIEKLLIGDHIKSYDVASRSFREGTVSKVYQYETESYFEFNNQLRVTAEHPLLVNGRWVKAKDVRAGNQLMSASNIPVPVVSVKEVTMRAPVYNLTVEPYETYVAGGVIVHNKRPAYPAQEFVP